MISNYISPEELAPKSAIWAEFQAVNFQFEYNAFGSTTLPIPKFYAQILRETGQRIINQQEDDEKLEENQQQSLQPQVDLQYKAVGGRRDLREAFIEHFEELKQFSKEQLNFKNAIVTPGIIGAIQAIIETFVREGDEIIAFEPIYYWHFGRLKVRKNCLKTVKFLFNEAINRFEIDFQTLKSHITDKTRIILLSNPNNPTGRIFSTKEFDQIADLIKNYPDIMIVEDAAYFLYHSDNQKPIPFGAYRSDLFKRTLTCYSGGKMYNVTGVRMGFVLGGEENVEKVRKSLLDELAVADTVQQEVYFHALKRAKEEEFYEKSRQQICEIQKKVTEGLKGTGVSVIPSEGTYYQIWNIENLRDQIEEEYHWILGNGESKTEELDKAFCRKIYKKFKIGAFPLSAMYFGANPPANFVRVSINRKEKEIKFLLESIQALFGPEKMRT